MVVTKVVTPVLIQSHEFELQKHSGNHMQLRVVNTISYLDLFLLQQHQQGNIAVERSLYFSPFYHLKYVNILTTIFLHTSLQWE